ncbi:oocyte zinc finger protein XlCOF19-like [Centruroides sculpturatus]|uniref:oocyte zinc finger protein XlCOF19-like n=1 Tax=Centruroides sculpturatus TaxID=218467 RepID=UPI000C6D45D6|nr:oocyte zinc finger protein XlCOF19-like [Centruroides sculpturatus]
MNQQSDDSIVLSSLRRSERKFVEFSCRNGSVLFIIPLIVVTYFYIQESKVIFYSADLKKISLTITLEKKISQVAEDDFSGLNNQKSRNGKYRCGSCEKEFVSEKGLKCHRRIHTGEGLLSCKYCNRQFTQTCHLVDHVKTHTRDKLFVCDHCKQRFTQKSNLIAHLRTHTGEKPFSCNHCSQKFRFKSSLKYHINKYHNSNE